MKKNTILKILKRFSYLTKIILIKIKRKKLGVPMQMFSLSCDYNSQKKVIMQHSLSFNTGAPLNIQFKLTIGFLTSTSLNHGEVHIFKHRLYISASVQARVLILGKYVLLGVINTLYKHCNGCVIL